MKRLALLACLGACGPRVSTHPPPTESDLTDLDVEDDASRPELEPHPEPQPRPETLALTPTPTPALESTYRGRTVDIDFKDMELHDVFRMLGEVGGVNMVVADDIRGSVTLRLRRVPWDQVLDTVVKMKGLTLTIDRGLYLITL